MVLTRTLNPALNLPVIDDRIKESDLFLLLITPTFLLSDYCRKEWTEALERHAAGAAAWPDNSAKGV